MLFKVKDRELCNSLGKASLVGVHLVAGTFVGLAIGYFLDKWLGTEPWLLLAFLVIGIAAGFKNMFKEVKSLQRNEEKRNDDSSGS